MTKQKEKELKEDIKIFKKEYSKKFRAGDEKYKGTKEDFNNFTAVQLLEQALAENLDQFSYIRKAIKLLSTGTKSKK